jgi:hypothetical protein
LLQSVRSDWQWHIACNIQCKWNVGAVRPDTPCRCCSRSLIAIAVTAGTLKTYAARWISWSVTWWSLRRDWHYERVWAFFTQQENFVLRGDTAVRPSVFLITTLISC